MKLLIEDDQGNRSVVPVIRDEITIGRKEGNTIRLTERNVSRHHARLVRHNGTLYVEDVEARYGVKKNGQKVEERAKFGEGDVVLIGDYRLTLRPEQANGAEAGAGEEMAAEFSSDLEEGSPPDGPRGRSAAPTPTGGESETRNLDTTAAADPGEPETRNLDAAAAPDPGGPEAPASQSDTQIIETRAAELVVVSSNFAGQKFPLDRGEMVIGRGENCDIIIDHRSVSNTHAKVVREAPESYKIVDLNSRNGVKIDGDQFKSAPLEAGDIVELGHVKFRFVAPDEDYVFTPDDQRDGVVAGQQPGAGTPVRPILFGAGAIVVAAVAVGIYFATAGGRTSGQEEKQGRRTAEVEEESRGTTENKKSGGDGEVADRLDEIEESIEEGELEEAIGALEDTRKLLEPSPEQNSRIDDLLSRARNEEPFRRRYDKAREGLENGHPEQTLENISKIPSHSVFRKRVEEEKLRAKALARIVETARSALDQQEWSRAEKLAKVAADYDSHEDEAESLLDEIESARKAEREPKRVADNRSAAGAGPANSSEDPSTARKSAEPDAPQQNRPPDRGISAEKAKELEKSAMSKVLKGNSEGAIADCKRALRAGRTACHRVLGLAYKKQGSSQKACRQFGTYVETSPSDESRIRNMMAEMGCE